MDQYAEVCFTAISTPPDVAKPTRIAGQVLSLMGVTLTWDTGGGVWHTDLALCTTQALLVSAQHPDAVQSQSAFVQQAGPIQGPTGCHTFVLLSVLPVKSLTALYVRPPSDEAWTRYVLEK